MVVEEEEGSVGMVPQTKVEGWRTGDMDLRRWGRERAPVVCAMVVGVE